MAKGQQAATTEKQPKSEAEETPHGVDEYGDRIIPQGGEQEGACYLIPHEETPDAAWALAQNFRMKGMVARAVTTGGLRRIVRVEECRPQELQKMVGNEYRVMTKMGGYTTKTRTFKTLDGEIVRI